jgi:hypothetical protein
MIKAIFQKMMGWKHLRILYAKRKHQVPWRHSTVTAGVFSLAVNISKKNIDRSEPGIDSFFFLHR